MLALAIVVIAAQVVLYIFAAQLIVLAAAAWWGWARSRRHPRGPWRDPITRFAVMVPAHDEEAVLGNLLSSLGGLDYPKDLYTVYVVVDNCTDATAKVARDGGAICLERTDDAHLGKGYALRWLIERILEQGTAFDAFVVFDADSVVDEAFLRAMDRELRRAPAVLQGHYGVRNQGASALTAITTLAFSLQQYVKPLGRTTLGLSVRLLGNGMCFPADVIAEHRWGAFSISEDHEFYLMLILAGVSTRLVRDAVVLADMPTRVAGATSQRVRWEKGKYTMPRTYVGPLVAGAFKRRDASLLDAALELVAPPFTSLVLLVLLLGAVGVLWAPARAAFSPVAWWVVIAGLVGYVATGAVLTGLRGPVLARALLVAPAFALWKVWIEVRTLLSVRDRSWVRTPRETKESTPE